jgi:hypothetical protein
MYYHLMNDCDLENIDGGEVARITVARGTIHYDNVVAAAVHAWLR